MKANGPSFASIDEVQSWVLSSILDDGQTVAPRGLDTRELIGVSFCLESPKKRCVTNSSRRWNLPLALGELCWHLSASNDLQQMVYYEKRWSEYTDDGTTLRGSCYGHRIFGENKSGITQWQSLVRLFHADPSSRRGVLNLIDQSSNLDPNAKDVACASLIQFLVRGNRLDTIVYMRSNDAIWGLPYDVFFFTMLQEMLACELGIELGRYYHTVGSLHLYSRHYGLAERIVREPLRTPFEMPRMEHLEHLPRFLGCESRLRSGGDLAQCELNSLSTYWRELLEILDIFQKAKNIGSYDAASAGFPVANRYRIFIDMLGVDSRIPRGAKSATNV
jgi:thymidylate synthase